MRSALLPDGTLKRMPIMQGTNSATDNTEAPKSVKNNYFSIKH